MKKHSFVKSAAFLLAVLFLLLSGSQALARESLKVATLAPRGLGWAASWEKLVAPWIAQATDNQYVFRVYWGGSMGNDDEYISKMRIGQLQGAGCTGVGATLASPEFSVVSLPFLFNNYDEVDYIRAIMYPTFDFYFLQNDFKLVLWIDQDFDLLFSTKYKFDTLEDFGRSKILTWFGPQEAAMLKALGASPIPMAVTDVPTAKRTGILDTNIAPSIWQVGSQLYTIDKYVNLMRIRYSPAVVILTKDVWNRIPADYQKNVMAEREQIQTLYCQDIRTDNAKSLQGMIDYGVTPVMPAPEQLAQIKRRAMTVYNDLSGNLYPVELLREVEQHLAAFRRTGTPPARVAAAPAPASRPAPAPAAPAPATRPAAPVMPPSIPSPVAAPAPAAVPTPELEVIPEPLPAPVAVEQPAVEEPVVLVAPPPEMVARTEAEPDHLARVAAAYAQEEEELKEEASKLPPPPAVAPAPAPTPERRATAWAERRRQISEVQKILKPMGLYDYAIDGIYGPITRSGIITYQSMHGLSPTGIVDETLLDHMGIK
jgi:TRAP-type C4-dicarboxylate transport system substrate-binding protein